MSGGDTRPPSGTLLLIEPDGLLRSTVSSVCRELQQIQIQQATSVAMAEPMLKSGMADGLPFYTRADYESYLKRLALYPKQNGDGMVITRQAIKGGYVLPCSVLGGFAKGISGIVAGAPEGTRFYEPFTRTKPRDISDADWAALQARAVAVIRDVITPEYGKWHDLFVADYLPKCRKSDSASTLPGGAAWYASRVRTHTTTDLPPDQIHQIGLDEVARIGKRMDAIAAKAGYPSRAAFIQHLRTDPSYYAKTPEELLRVAARHIEGGARNIGGDDLGQGQLRSRGDGEAAAAGPDAILVPKVNDAADVAAYNSAIAAAPASTQLWAMIETCRCLFNLPQIAEASTSSRMTTWVMGTNDLAKEMRARQTPDRAPFHAALSLSVAAARLYGLTILDGVYNDIDNEEGLSAICEQGVDFGFDGKTLIHPKQVEICNRIFSPSEAEVAWAKAVIAAFALPENQGKGAIRVEGRMAELLHLVQAESLVAVAAAIAEAAAA